MLVRNAWLIPFFPLLGALIVACGGRYLKEKSHLPVVGGIGIALLLALGLLFYAEPDISVVSFPWLEAGTLRVPIEMRIDGLTTMMLAMVTFVSTLVAVFAVGYMAGDPGYPRFFACVGLFVFSMTGLVLSNNYVLTYAFWEGVGVCSYLLVGFWHAKPSAAAAAKKAFMVNRLGDVGFAIALFWLWFASDTPSLSYQDVLNPANLSHITARQLEGIALLLFWAATAKSAQVPLYVWLPDAMEGPTPVSALIHAATMVTAGVYLVARSTPIFAMAPIVQLLVASVGCLTALLAAAIALTQTDLKRVLAYSTVSQLGYMFMALGAGIGNLARFAVIAAMFHLFTHAFFKALLFLGSGSVMHAMGGIVDMRRFRGLKDRLPTTYWTFAVGGLALSGIFPFAGFWSKDEILSSLRMASREAHSLGISGASYTAIYWIALFTALLTAFYTGRAFFSTFWGPEKLPSPDDPEAGAADVAHGSSHADPGHGHDAHDSHGHDAHLGYESPLVMTVPLMILAVCAFGVGFVFGWPTHSLFASHLERTLGFAHSAHEHGFDWFTAFVGTLAGVLGLVASWALYAKPSPLPAQIATRLGPLYRASYNKFYVDEIYATAIVTPARVLASINAFLDERLVHGVFVRGTAWIPRLLGRYALAPLQNGLLQYYAAISAVGLVGLFWFLLFMNMRR